MKNTIFQFRSVRSLSCVWLFAAPWTSAHQASLSITNSRSLLKLMSKSMMPSNHLILCHPLLLPPSILPSIRVFSNESVLHIRWPKYCSLTLSLVHPMNIQDWFPLGLTGLISLQSKGLSKAFFNTTVQKHQFFGAQLSLQSNSHICTRLMEKSLTIQTSVGKMMSLLFNMLSRLVIAFLPRNKYLLISWLHSLYAVIWDCLPQSVKQIDFFIFENFQDA